MPSQVLRGSKIKIRIKIKTKHSNKTLVWGRARENRRPEDRRQRARYLALP